jgi:hypothetical protein
VNWFKHDTDATTDAKLKKLIIRHGAVGYAVYFHCLELIAGDVTESNITFQLEHDSEIIAENLHIKGSADQSGIAIVEEIMRTIIALGLFQEAGGHIFCFKLLKRIDLSMTGNSKLRAAITGARANHDAIMISHDPIMLGKGSIGECSGVQGNEVEEKKEASLPSEALALAKTLNDLHLSNIDQKAKRADAKTLFRWAEDISKLNRIDGRTWDEIEDVIRWVKTPGQFWAPNIMSGKKLREKFDTIMAQMKRGGPVKAKERPGLEMREG